ncbi:hypothetical protein [Streptomyces sp. NPDC046909]|uniref:hypothetical protein n=1 Tax=Streptomyces sp. NPDC046909 TaxID=3155617 RepID=UPI003402DCC2
MRAKNTVATLTLLPVNFLAVAGGWWVAAWSGWAAGWDEQSYDPPTTELGVLCGVVAAIGVALLAARLWGAALFQVIPVIILLAFMNPS